jgi:RHS repeat-associated protein
MRYAPWGETRWVWELDGEGYSNRLYTSQIAQNRNYVGQLYDYGSRFYSSATGRWVSADNSIVDGPNRYAYVRNNPLLYVDPDGQAAFCLIPPITFACGAAVVIVGVVAVVVIGGVIVCSHTDCSALFRGPSPVPIQAAPQADVSRQTQALPQTLPQPEPTVSPPPIPIPEPTNEDKVYKLATSPIANRPDLDSDTRDGEGISLVNKAQNLGKNSWWGHLTTIGITSYQGKIYTTAYNAGDNVLRDAKAAALDNGYIWVEPNGRDHAEETIFNNFKNKKTGTQR